MFNTPFTQPQQIFAAWQAMMAGQTDQLEQLTSQMADAEKTAMSRANEAIDEYAKLMKASLRYNQQLMTAWRTQFVDNTKNAVETATTATQAVVENITPEA